MAEQTDAGFSQVASTTTGSDGGYSLFVGLMLLTTARRRREQQDLAGYI